MKVCRYGIMGPGRIAAKFAETFRMGLVKDAELVGVASTDARRAETFAKEFGIRKVYANYGDMLADPEIDAVYVATVNARHFECCTQSLASGKHVLCEKPMCCTAKEVKGMAEEARKAGMLLMEAMWSRFTPAMSRAAKWVRDGKIGQVKNISAALCVARDPVEYARLYDPKQGGGAVFDMGVYGIQLVQFFSEGNKLKKISSVQVPAATGVDESTWLHMIYEGGLVGEIKCSIGWHGRNDAWVCGEKGYIRIAPFFNFAQQAELYLPPYPAAGSLTPPEPTEVFSAPSPSGFEHEINHFTGCVLRGEQESPVMPLAHSLEIAEIFDRIAEEKV